jgi:heme A synthase
MDGVSGPSGGVAAGARADGGGRELHRFRRLSDLTVVAIFLLVVVGGIVRVSESGLGCGPGGSGTEGWPLCGGAVIPLVGDTSVLIEFSHRVLAAVVGVMIGLLVWRAYRGLRELRWPLRGSIAAGVLVLAQAGLGGLTVEKNLEDELVAAHLGLAMLLLGLILWLSVRARAQDQAAALPAGNTAPDVQSSRTPGAGGRAVPGLKPFAAVAVALLLAAIVAGGYVAGTEEEGVAGGNANGAHLACGKSFPTCLSGDRYLPFGESRLTDIHLTHRVLVYAASAAILALLGIALARGARSRLLWAAGGLLVAQLLLGALNVWLGEHAALVVAHLTVATLLWSSVLLIAFRLAWAPAPSAARSPAAPAEAAAVA